MDTGAGRLRRRRVIAGALGGIALAGGARAQVGGGKPIRILVGFSAGGGNDVVARIVAQKMGETMGQSLIVDNKPGASGLIAADILAKAPADGLTLMVASQTTYCVAPVLYRSVRFDATKDCVGVALLGASPLALVVHPSLAVKSVAELIALAKAKPGVINVGHGGVGTTPHMAAELFMSTAGIRMTPVPYRGEAPALNDLLSGQLPVLFSNISVCLSHVKSGALRALGVTSAARSAVAPDLSTIAESGLPGFENETWFGLTSAPGTPREVLARLNAEVRKALADAEVKRRFAALGMSVGSGGPEQLDALIRSEGAKWGKVIRDAGIKPVD
ncbi:MAG: Bug family tripartite tricarboxylate transporter substrate binding protein [Reyranellaceae bacterium]